MSKRRTYLHNAALLTGSGLVLRALGMGFRIVLAAYLGSEGMGLYQLILALYMVFVSFATAGVNVASARLAAQSLARGSGMAETLRGLCITALGFGTAAMLAQSVLAGPCARYLLHDVRAETALLILAPSLPFMAVSGAVRGCFLAARRVQPNITAQLIEQLVRMAVAAAGLRVLVLETAHPAAIRRQVSLCEAVYEGETAVEGMRGIRVETLADADAVWAQNAVPVLIDPTGACLPQARPAVLVDAIIAKKNLSTTREMAPLTIALGPGFVAGQDVDAVVETKRGHRLGRIIREGSAIPNTGIPGVIGGYGAERVIHAQAGGVFMNVRKIGDLVEKGEVISTIRTSEGKDIPVTAQISGILRGLLRSGYPVTPGFKIADIDPRREELSNCFLISDKSRCIAGSVLELVCAQLWN